MWKEIKDYNGYMINEYGDIKRLEYKSKRLLKQGVVDITFKEKLIKVVNISKSYRYRTITITKLDGTNSKKMFQLHRLVYETFIGNIKDGYVIDHIDNDRNNNHYSNLQMITQKENITKYFNENFNNKNNLEDGKICSKCNVKKDYNNYFLSDKSRLNAGTKNIYRGICKSCVNIDRQIKRNIKKIIK